MLRQIARDFLMLLVTIDPIGTVAQGGRRRYLYIDSANVAFCEQRLHVSWMLEPKRQNVPGIPPCPERGARSGEPQSLQIAVTSSTSPMTEASSVRRRSWMSRNPFPGIILQGWPNLPVCHPEPA
jgi:hypothetical protein